MLIELIRQKRKQKSLAKEEWLPIVNEKGEVAGQAPRSKVHNVSKLLHPVVHMHVINRGKAILLQKRAPSKEVFPGKWDTAVGGHISAGEKLEDAFKREAYEEIGLKDFSARLLKVFKWESEDQAELVYLFTTFDYKNHKSQTQEVSEARFWTKNQIKKQLGTGIFTPNFEMEYEMLRKINLL